MSESVERIDQEIQSLPISEQVELSQRLSERLTEQRPVPTKITFRDGDDLEQKCVDALSSPAAPMTDDDWKELTADAQAHYQASRSA